MKIRDEHYKVMADKIALVIEKNGREKVLAHKAGLVSDPRVKDLNMRFRWDLFWCAGLSQFASDVLYKYVHDSHIDTALRSIVSDLNLDATN